MYSKINYTLVGLFVVLFTAALLGFGFWLAKYGFEQKYDYYVLYFNEPVDGLTLDSGVKFQGVDVGKVTDISIDPKDVRRVRVLIRLKAGTPITRDMYGVLKLQGITGLSYVSIEGGHEGAKLLHGTESHPAVIATRESLTHQLTQSAPELLAKIQKAVDGLQRVLSKKNQQHFETILDNTAKATGKAIDLEEKVIALSGDFNATMQRFDHRVASMQKQIDRIGSILNEKLPPALESFRNAGEKVAKAADGISQISSQLERKLQRGEYDLRRIVRPIRIDLSELSYRYQELAEDLKNLARHPSSILFGSGSPQKGPGE